jgi:hypothetical protein
MIAWIFEIILMNPVLAQMVCGIVAALAAAAAMIGR